MDEKILVAFGNYLLSDERKQSFLNNTPEGAPDLEARLSRVHNEDITNFFDTHQEYVIQEGIAH